MGSRKNTQRQPAAQDEARVLRLIANIIKKAESLQRRRAQFEQPVALAVDNAREAEA